MRRVVIVSHASTIRTNQVPFALLRAHGWDPLLVVPARWRNDYGPVQPHAAEGLEHAYVTLPVLLPGRQQRHVYLASARRLLRRTRPDVLFVDEEPFSVPAYQWVRAGARSGVPAGVRIDENLDRPLPHAARAIRRAVLRRAAFVVARTPAAAELALRHGARRQPAVVPYGVDGAHAPERRTNGRFTVGFAGRLVPEKGVHDLLAAARSLGTPVRLLFAGNGVLREELERAASASVEVEVVTDLGHERMRDAYARMDVLVLPSRTTETWMEQFGRVLLEALAAGVPVVGSDSGAIPWVVEQTGGGLVFPEGDVAALAQRLATLRDDPALRASLAARGGEAVRARFTVESVAMHLADVFDRAAAEPA